MATASKVTKKVTKTVIEEVPDGVILHLTDEEAQLLHSLLGLHIVGSYDGPRKITNMIWSSLDKLGIENIELNCSPNTMYINRK